MGLTKIKDMAEQNIKLSIIIPAYNVAEYIQACIESCEAQDIKYSEYELIIVNDGSTDNTCQVIKSLQLRYPNIILINQSNQGQSVARNKGIEKAQGSYIWFVDSDDCITKNCIGSVLQFMEKNDLDAFNVISCTESRFQPTFSKEFFPTNISKVVTGPDFIIGNQPITLAPWGYIFKTAFWRRYNFSFIPNIYHEDAQLLPIVISKCSKIAAVSKQISLYSYTLRPGSTVNSRPDLKKIKGYAAIADTHMKYANELEQLEIKQYFEYSASYAFIEGIKMIYHYGKDYKSLIYDYCHSISVLPQKVQPTTFWRSIYRHFILHHPLLYCKIRSFLQC